MKADIYTQSRVVQFYLMFPADEQMTRDWKYTEANVAVIIHDGLKFNSILLQHYQSRMCIRI
jgi:hypothetical protein